MSLNVTNFSTGTIGPSIGTIELQFNETYFKGIEGVGKEFALGWIGGGVFLGMIVGSLIAIPVMKLLGRKLTVLMSGIIIFSATFGIFSHKYELLIFTRALVGVSVGLNTTLGPLYCTENSPQKVRGIVGTSFVIGVLSGVLLGFISLTLPNWKYMFGLNFITAIFLLVSFAVMPESSFWRGNKLKEFEEKINEDLMSPRADRDERGIIRKLLCDKRSLGKFLIGITLIIAYQFGGVQTIVNYLPRVLEDAHIRGITNTISTVIVAGWNWITCIFALILVDLSGRRILITVGMGIMFFCTFAMAIVFSFVPAPYSGWTFLVFVTIYLIGNNIGINSLLFLLFTELFDEGTREVAQPILSTIFNIVQFLVALFYLPIVALIGQGGVFWVISLANLVCWLIFIFFLPETKSTPRPKKYKKQTDADGHEHDVEIEEEDENDHSNPNVINQEFITEESNEIKEKQVEGPKAPVKFNSMLNYTDLKEYKTKDSIVIIQMHHLKGFEPELPNGYNLVAWILQYDLNKEQILENYFVHFGEVLGRDPEWRLEMVIDPALTFEYLLANSSESVPNPTETLEFKGFKTLYTVQNKGRPTFAKLYEYFLRRSILIPFNQTVSYTCKNGDQIVIKTREEKTQAPKLPHGYEIDALIEVTDATSSDIKRFYVLDHKGDSWRIDLMDNSFEDVLFICEQKFVQDDMRCLTRIYSGYGPASVDLILEKFNAN